MGSGSGADIPPRSAPHSAPSPAPPTDPSASYNVVYQRLVDGNRDIVGQLAYCLYKQSKQQYLQAFTQRNQRRPSDTELRNHVECSELPSLTQYRDKAERIVEELLAQAAQQKKEELEEHFKDRLWRFIERHKPESFAERVSYSTKALLFGGAGGVVGNILTTLLVIVFLFGSASPITRDDFAKSIKERFISGLAQTFDIAITINGTSRPALPVEPGPDGSTP